MKIRVNQSSTIIIQMRLSYIGFLHCSIYNMYVVVFAFRFPYHSSDFLDPSKVSYVSRNANRYIEECIDIAFSPSLRLLLLLFTDCNGSGMYVDYVCLRVCVCCVMCYMFALSFPSFFYQIVTTIIIILTLPLYKYRLPI